ncbi:LysR family transcriptional regulator [Lacibacterium aquatile]|uniref:LysR family transcriptional regulator n=1 Tax=Lacibacterium aquatile TaxID=1168082 RepID=A0ABW5DMQ5_9PROT
MKQPPLNWDDLRLFLAVMRAGSLLAAARDCGLSQPTLSRRIKALEDWAGVALFDRVGTSLRPTEDAAALLALAAPMAEAADIITETHDWDARRISGTVRIACGESTGSFLARIMVDLGKALPDVHFELRTGYAYPNLAKREVDIAVIDQRPTAGALKVRSVGHIAYTAYAHKDYAAAHPEAFTEERFARCAWATLDIGMIEMPIAAWLEPRLTPQTPVLRCSQRRTIIDAVLGGYGLGFLPCWLGDGYNRLTRVMAPPTELPKEIFLVVPEQVANRPAIRQTLDWLAERFRKEAALLNGTEPRLL